jgi:hypothetical protein
LILGRDMLYPIVGYSNYASILWRLHYAKLKFHQTAPLPFDRVEFIFLFYSFLKKDIIS